MWFELFGDYESPLWTINTAPIDTAKILKEKVYDVFDSIVFTSATLSVDSKFDYFKNLTGLSLVRDKAIAAKIYPSPFDYMKQVLFISPDHIPEPNSSAYNDELNEFLRQTIAKTGGSAFVLFTSYSQLGKSYDAVADYLEDKGIRALKQGQMPNGKLVTTFKDDIHSTLFGTDSFWEGVDAPGDTLRYVILTRLPFRMPSDPLEQAKVESMERRGLNAFMDYTLPSAVIRFKQGFGRLIRSKNDYGVVTLLDSRALNKSYGRTFFRSLPRCQFVTGSLAQLCDEIGKFFAENEGKDRHNKK
jgi:ATP-dependent DNA helicase DinG